MFSRLCNELPAFNSCHITWKRRRRSGFLDKGPALSCKQKRFCNYVKYMHAKYTKLAKYAITLFGGKTGVQLACGVVFQAEEVFAQICRHSNMFLSQRRWFRLHVACHCLVSAEFFANMQIFKLFLKATKKSTGTSKKIIIEKRERIIFTFCKKNPQFNYESRKQQQNF